MSTLAREVLPYLAQRHEITYVTAGDEVPRADFHCVVRGRRWKYMNMAGFELSRRVNALYRKGLIDLAVVWASIGFCLRGVPFLNLEGGSVYAQIRLFQSQLPWYEGVRFLPGFLHYVVPEIVCNRRAVRIIVPSKGLQQDLMRLHGLSTAKVAVVPHGVQEEHLAAYDRKSPSLPPRILFVGRLHFGKGIAAVLQEFLRRPDVNAEFVIVGDGPDHARMLNAAARDKRVQMLGTVPRASLESILITTNVFVFPTFHEGFGLALLEAMASGHACVAYDIPVTREVLGESGVYVPRGDSAAMIEAVARLVRSPAMIASYAAQAHERAGVFSWDVARASIDSILRETWATYRERRGQVYSGPWNPA